MARVYYPNTVRDFISLSVGYNERYRVTIVGETSALLQEYPYIFA